MRSGEFFSDVTRFFSFFCIDNSSFWRKISLTFLWYLQICKLISLACFFFSFFYLKKAFWVISGNLFFFLPKIEVKSFVCCQLWAVSKSKKRKKVYQCTSSNFASKRNWYQSNSSDISSVFSFLWVISVFFFFGQRQSWSGTELFLQNELLSMQKKENKRVSNSRCIPFQKSLFWGYVFF